MGVHVRRVELSMGWISSQLPAFSKASLRRLWFPALLVVGMFFYFTVPVPLSGVGWLVHRSSPLFWPRNNILSRLLEGAWQETLDFCQRARTVLM